MTKRTVLYARTNNYDNCQLAEQLQTCREYAWRRGWQILAELTDQGISGMSDKAPQLAHVLEMALAGEFDVLVVREIDRLSRDLPKLSAIMEEFSQAGVQIRCALDGCDYRSTREAVAETAKEVIVYARVSDYHDFEDEPDLIRQRQALWECALARVRSAVESLHEGSDQSHNEQQPKNDTQ
jgi:DNA invertase Pin-like site-specific DNA recombinase